MFITGCTSTPDEFDSITSDETDTRSRKTIHSRYPSLFGKSEGHHHTLLGCKPGCSAVIDGAAVLA